MPYEVLKVEGGLYQIRGSDSRHASTLDGAPLTDLPLTAVAEYLYALDLADAAGACSGKGKVRLAVERALRHRGLGSVMHIKDIVVSVRWMCPGLVCPDEVLAIWVRKIAAEHNVLLQT